MAGPLGGPEEDHQIQDQEVVDGTTPGQEVGDPQVDLGEEVGIEPGRLSAVGFGEHKPLDPEANNSLPANQAKNRRVESKGRYQDGAEEMDTAGVKKLLQEADLSAQEDLQGID